ncbi:hypothetical protein CK203_006663 [Vitis vinifera]|uniref:Uncharacterized protein n=1 Tax=Vitis vinifera TaxID=29760 RepID=A0A438KBA6_VITVI|nr:hypothetical protein CK203_006663 [Vitis vinifera]
MLKVLETTAQSEKMTTGYNGGQPKDIGQAHLSFVQPIEERSLKQGKFNQEEIEKLRTLLRTLRNLCGPHHRYFQNLRKIIRLAKERNGLYYLETPSKSEVFDAFVINPTDLPKVSDPISIPSFEPESSIELALENQMIGKAYSRKKATVPRLIRVQKSKPTFRNEEGNERMY